MRRMLAVICVAVATAFGAGSAIAQEIVIKFSHVVAPDTPKGKAALRFKELAEQYTRGRVRVEVYPDSRLYKDKEELEALQLGAVQMLAPSLAKFSPLGLREFELFDLPYLFPSREALSRVTGGPLGKTLFKRLEDRGIVGLAYWDNGFKIMSADRPLRRPADFVGLRMRVQSSRVLEAEMRALGAQPVATAFSDAREALATGLVDGTENPPSNMYTQHMHEVQRFATLSDHGYLGYAVIVNKTFWEGLPSAVRGQLERAMAEATRFEIAIADQENAEALAAMRAAGTTEFITLTPEEKAAWIAALKPVEEEMAARIGKDILDEIRKATTASR